MAHLSPRAQISSSIPFAHLYRGAIALEDRPHFAQLGEGTGLPTHLWVEEGGGVGRGWTRNESVLG